ncbi:MAG: hypothetical protein AB7L09_02275 [Nitrospira sp.]
MVPSEIQQKAMESAELQRLITERINRLYEVMGAARFITLESFTFVRDIANNWVAVYCPDGRLFFSTYDAALRGEADYWGSVLLPLLERALVLEELADI